MDIHQKIQEAEELFRLGDIQSAKKRFDELRRQNPHNSVVLNNLAVIAMQEGEVRLAEKLLWQAFQHDPDNADVVVNVLVYARREHLFATLLAWCYFAMNKKRLKDALSVELAENAEYITKQFILHCMEPDSNSEDFFHDRVRLQENILAYPILQSGKAASKLPGFHAAAVHALYEYAIHGNSRHARKILLNNHPEDSFKPLWLALLAVLWLKEHRIYEAIYFANQLSATGEAEELAGAIIRKAHRLEGAEEVQEAYRDILVVMEEGIGNMVMLTPALQAIRMRFPKSKISVLGKKPATEVIEGLNFVDEILHGWQEQTFDLVLCSVWSQETEKRYKQQFEKQTDFTYRVEFRPGLEHEAEANMKLAQFLGYRGDMPQPKIQLRPPAITFKPDPPLAVLANATQNNGYWERKRWPYFAELAQHLLDEGYQVVVVGGREEARRFDAKYWPEGVVNLQGKLSVAETAYVIKQADVFIGNDCGPAHLAAAVGTPTYVFFGATLISKNRPIGKNVRILTRDLPCSPCQYTERWQACKDWRCMTEMTPEWVLRRLKEGISPQTCVLARRNYRDLWLEQRDGRLFIGGGEKAEPFVVHLVGKGKTNFPWGMEIEVQRAFEKLGCQVFHTDYVADRHDFKYKFLRPAHLMLVFRGSGIPPELIEQVPYLKILWYQDDVFTTQHGPRDLAYNGRFFDQVYTFDYNAIEAYRRFGIQKVDWLPLAAAPEIYHKKYLDKKYDVVFVGNVYPNRKKLFDRLQKRFNVHVFQAYGEEAATIYNQSKIVLNLGIGRTGIQQRVFEVLLCGAFLMTNEIPEDGRLFEHKKHLVYFNEQNIEELIEYYLTHDDERNAIADNGYRKAIARHTFTHRVEKIIKDHFRFREAGTGKKTRVPVQKSPRQVIPGFAKINIERIRQRLETRSLRIFAAFRNFNWENPNLEPALKKFGELIRYDWADSRFSQYAPDWHTQQKTRMNQELFQRVCAAHEQKPVDIFFAYLSGRLVFPGILQAIRRMGILTLNIYLDDVKGFWGRLEPTGFSSMIDIANGFDLCWTTHPAAVEWYEAMGGRAVFLPPGANPEVFRPLPGIAQRDIEVVFVGQKYGRREEMIARLQAYGIDARGFGRGWDSGEVDLDKMIELFNRAQIVLGIGETPAGAEVGLQIKGRDFEVPMTGALYLTQHNPELSKFYHIGTEIDTYRDENELVEKVKYYLSHPEQAEKIRRNARERCLKEHTWEARFQTAFETLIEQTAE